MVNQNKTIDAGLRADIMRKQIETKNTLSSPQSLYVGLGSAKDISGIDVQIDYINDNVSYPSGLYADETIQQAIDNNHIIFDTAELPVGNNNQVLQIQNDKLIYDVIHDNNVAAGEQFPIISEGIYSVADYSNIANTYNQTSGELYINLQDETTATHMTAAEIKDYFLCNGQNDKAQLANLHCKDIECENINYQDGSIHGTPFNQIFTSNYKAVQHARSAMTEYTESNLFGLEANLQSLFYDLV